MGDDAGPNQEDRRTSVAEFRIARSCPGDDTDVGLRKPSSQRAGGACGGAGFRFHEHDAAIRTRYGLTTT